MCRPANRPLCYNVIDRWTLQHSPCITHWRSNRRSLHTVLSRYRKSVTSRRHWSAFIRQLIRLCQLCSDLTASCLTANSWRHSASVKTPSDPRTSKHWRGNCEWRWQDWRRRNMIWTAWTVGNVGKSTDRKCGTQSVTVFSAFWLWQEQ